MRVATWSLASGRASAQARSRLRQRVERVDADAWVLTGAGTDVAPGRHAVATSPAVAGSGHAVVLSAARLQPLPLPELPIAAAGVATVGGRPWLLVGVCLAARRDRSDADWPARWTADLDRLDAGLARLVAEAAGMPVVLAGDLGQTLEGHVVGSRVGRARLVELLHRHGLVSHTASAPSARAGCASVDHVCSAPPGAGVTTWSSIDTEAELLLADRLGYAVDL